MLTTQFIIIMLSLLAGFGLLYLQTLASEKAKTRVLNENLKHFTTTAESIKKNIELETSIRSGLHADTKSAVIAAYEALGKYKDFLTVMFYAYQRLTKEKHEEVEIQAKSLRDDYIAKKSSMELYVGDQPVMEGFNKVQTLCSLYYFELNDVFYTKIYRENDLEAIANSVKSYSNSSSLVPQELYQERQDLLKERGQEFKDSVESRSKFIEDVKSESEKLRRQVFDVISKPPKE